TPHHTPLPTYPFQRTRHWIDTQGTASESDRATVLGEKMRDASPEDQPEIVLDLVRRHAAVVLGFRLPHEVDEATSFRDQGMTSAVGAELGSALSEATGIRLATTAIYDFPTPQALAGHIHQQVRESDGATPSTAAAPTPTPAAVPRSAARGADDPVVIVGMACRYPGGADT
ncbi:acyl carrier protein, partial [Streptomyces tsukubensis]